MNSDERDHEILQLDNLFLTVRESLVSKEGGEVIMTKDHSKSKKKSKHQKKKAKKSVKKSLEKESKQLKLKYSDPEFDKVKKIIEEININNINPVQALVKLNEIIDLLKSSKK